MHGKKAEKILDIQPGHTHLILSAIGQGEDEVKRGLLPGRQIDPYILTLLGSGRQNMDFHMRKRKGLIIIDAQVQGNSLSLFRFSCIESLNVGKRKDSPEIQGQGGQ